MTDDMVENSIQPFILTMMTAHLPNEEYDFLFGKYKAFGMTERSGDPGHERIAHDL